TLSRHASDFWTRHRRVRAPSPPVSGGYSSTLRLSARLAMRGRGVYKFKRYFGGGASPHAERTTMPATTIAVIEGDGIGKEVVPEGRRVLEAAARVFGLDLRFEAFPWGCDHHARFGRMMPEDGLARIADHDAIFLGAVGWPTVSDVESLWTPLMAIRRRFQQYVNLRPVRLFEGVPSPLARPGDIDLLIVRENNEGEYSEIGGRMFPGTDQEMVIQNTVLTRLGCDRVMRYAFGLAMKRKGKLTSATKSNGIIHTMPFWDERFRAVAAEFPEVATEQFHIDILAAHFVGRPSRFDVVVASNLFGDILSDLGPAV